MAVFVLFGCKKPIENPHLIDPIYKDLEARYKETEAAAEKEEGTLAELKGQTEELEPRDVKIRINTREIYAREKMLRSLKQQQLYYQIRMEQRKKFAQEDYKRAFDADKPWPDPQEFKDYVEVKKLQAANRNWDSRVPKLTRHLKYAGKAPASAAAEGEKEGGGHGESAEKPKSGH